MRVRFGEFVLDDGARELTRAGERLAVSPKAFDLLAALLEGRPRVLSRPELQDRLWPESAVGYTSLPAVLTELRRVLGDDAAAPRFVRTVRGFGYAFCGRADADGDGTAGATAGPAFSLQWGGRQVALLPGGNVIGRQADCRVRIEDARASRHHARVTIEGERAVIEDLGSKNGTVVQGRRLLGPVALVDGDTVVIGDVALAFHAGRGSDSTLTG